ncbi:MAG: glycine cleavage system protein H [Planctomycetes bacterium]|jgi:glycine cleavage system H protein|nr:glycine cleavage system protein H [Planctomycetota bacterium]
MGDDFLAYRRAKFTTRLPTDRSYTEGHLWIAPDAEGHRVGFTRFATRMLGEVVEFDFEVAVGSRIHRGQAIGWVEGFKAVSDLYSPLTGVFAGANPELEKVIGDIHKSPYQLGWLFRVTGAESDDLLAAEGYAGFLDGTIDRMMGRS